VQALCHQVQLFLAEYNVHYHSGGGGSGASAAIGDRLPEGLPGYRPRRRRERRAIPEDNNNQVPEELLLQQRALLRSCDRLKLATLSPSPSSNSVNVVTQLGALFTGLVELMLSKEIKVRFF